MPTPQPNKNKPEEREVQDVQRHNPKQHIQMILREALSNLPTSRRTSLCIATSRGFNVALNSSPQGLRKLLGCLVPYIAIHRFKTAKTKYSKSRVHALTKPPRQNSVGNARVSWCAFTMPECALYSKTCYTGWKQLFQNASQLQTLLSQLCASALPVVNLLARSVAAVVWWPATLSFTDLTILAVAAWDKDKKQLMARSYKVPKKGSQWWSHQRAGAIFPNRHYISLNSCLLSPFLLCLQTRWPIMPHRLGRLGCLYWYTLGCTELTSEDR